MIWILVVVLLICSVYFAVRYFMIKHAMQDVEKQMHEIQQDITQNQILHLPLPNRSMETLTGTMNAILEDIRKEHQDHLQQEKEFQEQLENISHDLRTPLTVILGYLKFMRKDTQASLWNEEQTESLQIIERKARIMEVLVNEFYMFSRLHAQDYEIQIQKVDINRLVKESVMDHYQMLMEASLQVEADTKDYAVYVSGDAQGLQRILSNLIQNACRYAQSFFHVRISEQEQTIVIEFVNDCEPLKESEVEHMFDRFYKHDSARSQEGTGLGLTVAKSLAEAMQGSLMAELHRETMDVKTSCVVTLTLSLKKYSI